MVSLRSSFAGDKIDKKCLEYVPTAEEDRNDNDVNNIAMMVTSEHLKDWIAKTIVFLIVGCELRVASEFFMRVFDRVVSDGKLRNV